MLLRVYCVILETYGSQFYNYFEHLPGLLFEFVGMVHKNVIFDRNQWYFGFKITRQSSPDLQQIAPGVKKHAEFDFGTPRPSNHQKRSQQHDFLVFRLF